MTIAPDLRPDPALAARAAAARPTMTLDPDAVLGAAHRHSTRRTAGRVVASVAAVGAVAAVAVNLPLGGTGTASPAWRTSGPTSTDQVAKTILDGDLLTLARGVKAVNLPGPLEPASAAARAKVAGITDVRDLGLSGPGGTSVLMYSTPAAADGAARLLVTYADDGVPTSSGADASLWSWRDGATANDAVWAATVVDSNHRLDAALVPADLHNPAAVSFFDAPGGPSFQEVPLFDTGNGRLATVFTTIFTTTSKVSDRAGLVFVGDDGTVVEPPCPASTRCLTVDDVPGLAAQLQTYTPEGQREADARMDALSKAGDAVQAAQDALKKARTAAEKDAAQQRVDEAQRALDALPMPGG